MNLNKNKNNPELNIRIEGKDYVWNEQFISGEQLKKLANISLPDQLYLSLIDPWDDELIANDQKVDLARLGIENFYLRPLLKFKIDNKLVNWNEQFITGLQLKNLGSIPDNIEVYLKIKGKFEDDLIADNEKVDLARPGIEKFYSKNLTSGVVEIKIDDNFFEIKKDNYTGTELKVIGNVTSGYELEQVKDGIITIEDNTVVKIIGNEVFISHPRDGQSS